MEPIAALLEEMFAQETLIALTLSGPRERAPDGVRRVVVKPVLLREARVYQFEYHQERRVTHRNLPASEAQAQVGALLTDTFRHGLFHTADADVQVTLNRRHEAAVVTRPPTRRAADLRHDRQKRYLLPENVPCDFLIRLGVMRADGGVLAARYDKFRQINRFLEMVVDVADDLPADRPLRVVDFGCGRSALTFALYHYLHAVKGFALQIAGLDRKPDVVAHGNAVARDLGWTDLSFAVGDIKDYDGFERVDMVVSLHACDTATDDALVKAVQWGAKVILSVPCCQHELLHKIHSDTLRPLLKHGILKERLSALVTDSLRANLLELAGYAVQVLEFIETEHTSKNLLLRAVRRDNPAHRAKLLAEYRAFRDFWGLHPYMETALDLPDPEPRRKREGRE